VSIPDDKTYTDKVVSLCEYAGEAGVLDGFRFEGCDIKGPAVVVLQGEGSLVNCTFQGEPDALLWEVPVSRTTVIGVILLKACHFEQCTFINVGFAGPPDFITSMKRGSGIG
jgi:hypothetical protein